MGMQSLLNVVFPPQCLTCETPVETSGMLCGPCWREISFISGLRCTKCGVPLPGDSSDTELHCDDCMQTARPWRYGSAAIMYRDGGRALILRLKHADATGVAQGAALWMHRSLRTPAEDYVCLPVPLHWMRRLKRRYNQSALLARHLAAMGGYDYAPEVLTRPVATPSLDGRSKEERFRIAQGKIAVTEKFSGQIKDRSVLLIDDVMTSGATLAAASEACLRAGARSVDVCVLARVAKDA